MWLATTTGKVATRQADGSFSIQTVTSALNGLNDIAFKPGASTGIAVGDNGYIERTTNGGATWARVPFTEPAANDRTDPYACGGSNNGTGSGLNQVVNPLVPLYSVHWGPNGAVLVTGHDGTVLRSTNDGATFTEINRYVRTVSATDSTQAIGCRIGNGVTPDVFDAQFASASDPGQIFFKVNGTAVYYTGDGLATGAPVQTSSLGCAAGVFARLAIDPANPLRQWAATDRDQPGDSTCFTYATTNAAGASAAPDVPNRAGTQLHRSEDVAVAGTSPQTVVTVGTGGDILNSLDGRTFYVNRLSSSDATDWYAVAGYDKDHFAVGGANGALALTSAAGTVPDLVAPTGSITGPGSAHAGLATTYTATLADNAGGSGIDPASITWTAAGTAGGAGNPVSLRFPKAGSYPVQVRFADRAGNVGSASLTVTVTGKAGETTQRVHGGRITVRGPQDCVPPGGRFPVKVTQRAKKGADLQGVSRARFSVDGKRTATDTKPPFAAKLKATGLAPGRHVVKATLTLRPAHGRRASTRLALPFDVCG